MLHDTVLVSASGPTCSSFKGSEATGASSLGASSATGAAVGSAAAVSSVAAVVAAAAGAGASSTLGSASLGLSECLPIPLTNEVNRVERRRWALAALTWLDEPDSRRQDVTALTSSLGASSAGLASVVGSVAAASAGAVSASGSAAAGAATGAVSLDRQLSIRFKPTLRRTHVSLTPSSATGAGAEVDASATGSAVGSAARTAGASTGAASAAGASTGASATTGTGSAFSDWFGQRGPDGANPLGPPTWGVLTFFSFLGVLSLLELNSLAKKLLPSALVFSVFS